jgi:methylphosphotriester-DNA--protein-cysteine methyltransferase
MYQAILDKDVSFEGIFVTAVQEASKKRASSP